MHMYEVGGFELINCALATQVIVGSGKVRSLDHSLGCKHDANGYARWLFLNF